MRNPMQGQWSKEKVWEWYNSHPWIRGFNGYPSNCVNRIAMWQEYNHEAVAEQIEYEFGLAEETGFNAVRTIIQFELWYYQHDSFMKHLEQYITMAAAHGLGVMLVLGNDCCTPKELYAYGPENFGEQKVDWGYHSGIKRGPHGRKYGEHGYLFIDEPGMDKEYFRMVSELAEKYGKDPRILIWNVWNEIGNGARDMLSVPYMEGAFSILREAEVIQPLTAEMWSLRSPDLELAAAERRALELSDIISFHYYFSYEEMIAIIEYLKGYGRPIINTEWLNRFRGNTIETIFPLFYLEKIGSFHWGLIQGYSQTWEPYISFFRQPEFEEGTLDLTKWQHDLYRFNGYPYDPKEIRLIKKFCAMADKRDLK